MSVTTTAEDLSWHMDARVEDLNAVITEVAKSLEGGGQATRGLVEQAARRVKASRDALFERLVDLRARPNVTIEEVGEVRRQAEALSLDAERGVQDVLWALRDEGDAVGRVIAARTGAYGLAWGVRMSVLREEFKASVTQSQHDIAGGIGRVEDEFEVMSQLGEISSATFAALLSEVKIISLKALRKLKKAVD
jgi:hypothetical protein